MHARTHARTYGLTHAHTNKHTRARARTHTHKHTHLYTYIYIYVYTIGWVNCLYKAALGPDAGTPGGAVAGMSTTDLIAAWTKPFLPEAEGGCPPQGAWVEAV